MSHHGYEPFEEMDGIKKLLAGMQEASKDYRGPIGAYPHGKLSASDEGSLQFAVGGKDGKVILDFGAPTSWVGMTPQQAMDLAASIISRARVVAAESGLTVHMTIGG